MISRSDFEMWIAEDIHLLRLVAHRVACKLYQSSYNRGAQALLPALHPAIGLHCKICREQSDRQKGRSDSFKNQGGHSGRAGNECENDQSGCGKAERGGLDRHQKREGGFVQRAIPQGEGRDREVCVIDERQVRMKK